MLEENTTLRSNIIWNAIGCTASAVTSLLFMIIITRINGVNDAGVFAIAFTSAMILSTIGFYGVRNYQVTDIHDKYSANEYIGARVVTAILMMIIAILFTAINHYDFYKTIVVILLCLSKALECFSDVYYGIMQKHGRLNIVGKSLFMKAFFGILIFAITLYFTKNLVYSILTLIIVNVLIIIFYDLIKVSKFDTIKPKFDSKKIFSILFVCFAIFAFSFLSLLNVNFPKYSIDAMLPSASQTIYGIIVMPATAITLLCQFTIQPALTRLANYFKNKDLANFNKLIILMCLLITFFTAIFEILCYFFGIWGLNLLYGLELSVYKYDLLIVVFGSLFSSIALVLSAVLTTIRITWIQLLIFVLDTILAIIISPFLLKYYGISGACYAYAIIMFFQLFGYSIVAFANSKRKNYFKD